LNQQNGDARASRSLIVMNPAAGQDDAERVLRLVAGAFAVRGRNFDVVLTRGAGHAADAARRAVDEGYVSVIAVGGDGTVGEVITGIAGSGVPVGIVPKGTGNQVARNLGLPARLEDAVDVAVNGACIDIDLGRLDDGRLFAVAAGAGWDAAVMAAATRELKDRWGFGAYLYAGLRLGISPPTARYRITADGEAFEVDAAMVLVANMGQFTAAVGPPLPVHIAPDVSYRDGLLDVCIFAPRNIADAAAIFWRVARRRYAGDPRLVYLQARDVRVESDPPAITEIDGEPSGHTPFRARVLSGGVSVLVPTAVPAALR
jgi:diacylglycerol kinase (ATP)